MGRPANCKHGELTQLTPEHYQCRCGVVLAVVEVASFEKMLRHSTARVLARLDTVHDDLRELDERIRELRARIDARWGD